MSIRDLMTPDPVTANLRDGLHQTYHRMRERSIRHMPVLGEDGGLAGIITERDLLRPHFLDDGAEKSDFFALDNSRKVAEAIPKLDDSARIMSYQTIFGDLSQYWTVRPLESMADLDRQLPAAELLTQAFGPAEGGLIFRTGLEAMARVEREMVVYRPELSNPA